MVDWILDKIRETDVDEIHLVTNHRFAADFQRWAPEDVTVHDDGTTSNDDRLGAIGDIQFVGLDDDRIVSFVEKPADPPSTLAATATYLYARDHVALVETYLAEGNPPDQPGNLVRWLHTREPVYAYRFEGSWWDIGDREQLLAADNVMRRRQGLPERAEYSLQN